MLLLVSANSSTPPSTASKLTLPVPEFDCVPVPASADTTNATALPGLDEPSPASSFSLYVYLWKPGKLDRLRAIFTKRRS